MYKAFYGVECFSAPRGACNLFCIQGRRCIVTPSGPRCVPTPTCNDLKCPAGKVCKQDDTNKAASCVSYQADSPGNGCTPTSCPPNQKCVVQTGTRVVCIPTQTCSTLRCGAGTKCYPGDSNDDAQCVPYSTCTTTLCDSNSRCVEGNGVADARCVPIAVCTTPCLAGTVCRKGRCVTTCDQKGALVQTPGAYRTLEVSWDAMRLHLHDYIGAFLLHRRRNPGANYPIDVSIEEKVECRILKE
ncbi:hypothetical protein ANCDUO_11391 [Ancylostoma duodenale]|uniref:Follistatin-like domain-containing protein n=1 Tax=Ancylostoma duodenale TaxID=51022 RepID=A0A0C2D8B4_9BILA|nr:hypothetical protein ANCDUO_11391 [Ancylostoma duodenale]